MHMKAATILYFTHDDVEKAISQEFINNDDNHNNHEFHCSNRP